MTAADLLAFARGPALWFSLLVLFAGSAWRVAATFRLGATPDLAEPRSSRLLAGALRGILGRMITRPEFRRGRGLSAVNGYLYHIGLAVIVFGFPAHPVRRAPDRARLAGAARMAGAAPRSAHVRRAADGAHSTE
jgi:hypothetical protein